MILAIDMGNTNIKIGVVDGIENIIEERVTTAYDKTSLEYASDILAVLDFHKLPKDQINGAIVSSVVPPLTGILATAVRKVLGIQPLIVSSDLKMDIGLHRFRYPKSVGVDILVGIEAAFHTYHQPCIVVNMGTATTVMVVDEDGEFLGGSIVPGMKLSANALASNTATLPEINMENPGRVISRDTEQSIRSGIVYSTAAGIDELIGRAEAELGKKCVCIATGGMARFAIPYCKHEIIRDDKLLMKGLLRIYEMNRQV